MNHATLYAASVTTVSDHDRCKLRALVGVLPHFTAALHSSKSGTTLHQYLSCTYEHLWHEVLVLSERVGPETVGPPVVTMRRPLGDYEVVKNLRRAVRQATLNACALSPVIQELQGLDLELANLQAWEICDGR